MSTLNAAEVVDVLVRVRGGEPGVVITRVEELLSSVVEPVAPSLASATRVRAPRARRRGGHRRRGTGRLGSLDDAFLRYGFAKPRADDRRRSSPPDRFLPVNFAFRLRDLLGVSARAEIVRFLVPSRARDATVSTVAEARS